MKTKKIILILFLILSLSFVLTGCSTIGEFKTETIVANYLESEEGPESVVKQSFNKLLEEFSNNESLNDYEWSYSINFENVNIVDAEADADGSGILTAKNIVLVYNYQISGKPNVNNLVSIQKEGKLSYNIGSLRYDNNKEQLLKISPTQAEAPSQSPVISEVSADNSNGFSLNARIENYSADSSLGVISLGNRNFSASSNKVLKISTDKQISLNTDLTLAETDFASILVINYQELLNKNSEQTGLAAALIAVP